ncbi:MAG: BON domain-containing protein [Steroidobacteraceae bacterium]
MGRLLPAVTLGAASVGSLCSGIALCAPPPETLEKEIVVTATRPQDAELAAKVTTAFKQRPYLFADHVTVTAENGVVRVGGVVQDLPDLYAILRLARRIAGKGRVVNEIDYQPNDDDGN